MGSGSHFDSSEDEARQTSIPFGPLAASERGTSRVIESEVAFRALSEYDLRGADVAFISRQRWDNTPDDDNLSGSPELVIEVLSPSNTKREMCEKATLYLATGAEEFWIVDANQKNVTVVGREGSTVYGIGESIQLPLFGSTLAVTEIFA